MLVAYYRHYQIGFNEVPTPAKILVGFLEFYSCHFKPEMYGVNVKDQG